MWCAIAGKGVAYAQANLATVLMGAYRLARMCFRLREFRLLRLWLLYRKETHHGQD